MYKGIYKSERSYLTPFVTSIVDADTYGSSLAEVMGSKMNFDNVSLQDGGSFLIMGYSMFDPTGEIISDGSGTGLVLFSSTDFSDSDTNTTAGETLTIGSGDLDKYLTSFSLISDETVMEMGDSDAGVLLTAIFPYPVPVRLPAGRSMTGWLLAHGENIIADSDTEIQIRLIIRQD